MAFNHIEAARLMAPALRSPRPAHAIHWWEPLLPTSVWHRAAALAEHSARRAIDSGRASPRRVRMGMRLSSRFSRAAFNAQRFWTGKRG